MSNVAHIHHLWTKTGLAKELSIDKSRVMRLMRGVQPDGKTDKGGYEGFFLSTAIPIIFELDEEDSEEESDPEKYHPKDRKDWYDGEQRRVALEKDVGNLIPSDVHRRELALVITEIVNEFEALPDILERDCGATPDMVIKASKAVDKVRKQAYDRITKLPDE